MKCKTRTRTKTEQTVNPYANWNKPLEGGYGITNTSSATTCGEWKKKLMKIRCLKVFWYRFPTHTTHGCCAGVDFVSREIHGCLLLTWASISLFLRCLRSLLSTAEVIRRHFQRDSRGIISADCHLLTGLGADTFHASLWKLILMCLSPSWKVKNPSTKQVRTDLQGHVQHSEQHTNVTTICRRRITALCKLNSWKFEMQPL